MRSLFLGLFLALPPFLPSLHADGLPFSMPTPEGWRTETIPFPLSFAPSLPYRGLEELRFAPGMFRDGAADFWSYGFVWVTEEPLALDGPALARDLTTYFEGLAHAVRKSKKLPELRLDLGGELTRRGDELVGHAEAFDAFATQRQLRLRVTIRAVDAPAGYRGALYFALSPQPAGHPVWETLDAIGDGYRAGGES